MSPPQRCDRLSFSAALADPLLKRKATTRCLVIRHWPSLTGRLLQFIIPARLVAQFLEQLAETSQWGKEREEGGAAPVWDGEGGPGQADGPGSARTRSRPLIGGVSRAGGGRPQIGARSARRTDRTD